MYYVCQIKFCEIPEKKKFFFHKLPRHLNFNNAPFKD